MSELERKRYMEALEFLGGKYQQASQILPGTLQTFRAVDTSAGRDVFVHRVPANDPAAHQLALLLSSALIRSAKARKMVLDVVEADGFAYVVTDTEHQCLLLREWLQFEINQTGGGDASARPQAPAPPVVSKEPSLEDTDPKLPVLEEAPKPPPESTPEPPKREVGEFTRMFMAGTAAAQKETQPAAAQKQAAEKPAIEQRTIENPPAEKPAPEKPPADNPPAAKPASEPGEFTRFFRAGPPPEKSSGSEQVRTPERQANPDLGRTSFVQRPNTPLTMGSPQAQKSSEPGEFTRMFMQGGFTPTPSAPANTPSIPASTPQDPFGAAPGGGMFSQPAPASPTPSPAAKPMGEYTRIFGSGNDAPPPQQQSTVAAPPQPSLTDDPLLRTGGPTPQPPPSAPPPPARGPSEFTLVMSGGGRPSEAAPTNAPTPAPSSTAGGPGSIPLPKMQMNVAPPNPMQGLHVPPPPSAHVGGGGMSASSPMGSASAQVAGPHMPAAPPPMNFQSPAALKMPPPSVPAAIPAQNKNKLVILFIVLGVLAVLLIVLIVLLLKK